MTQNQTNPERILIIDDDQAIWKSYRQVLCPTTPEPDSSLAKINEILLGGGTQGNDSNFVLSFANQGQDGYQMVADSKEQNPFALAFVDIRMPPGWDGMETAVKIRQLDPDIELVIVTAYSDRSMEEIVRAVGSPDKLLFLHKPFDPDELKQITRSMTSKWRMARMEEQQRHARERIEEQLHQAQKMEAIGTLAGGIAHDFNNILSAIMGYTDLALMRIKGTHPEVESDLEQVRKASIRATDLVRQILTFSRRQTREKSPLLISVIIKEAMKLLRASIPTTIDIREEISSQATILADATQLHQLVMNLCTNAYHAMADYSGVLTVTLHDTTLAEGEIIVNNTPIAAGNYVTLSIKDTGTGIPHSVIANIFDPYFTTKEKGKGTGMGLAVVKGIVDSHNGAITVDSEPGQGSIFKVYLPASTAGSGAEKVIDASFSVKLLSTRHERIMVVDDESSLRELAYQFLTAAGYRVDLFANAEEASNALTQNPHAWHLLLTDLTMPGMTGEQLAIKAKQIKPDLPIIICSGDIQSLTNKEIAELNTSTCLQKPIDSTSLLTAVAESLRARDNKSSD
ncbi:MAG: response regulator [Proteobacteria bacterium]|nr:response regulator [Desulfobulbaceae bacterium]MBU4152860.1 response regulator [Pseudomonadota bacterium]